MLLWTTVPAPSSEAAEVVLVQSDRGALYREFAQAFEERLLELVGPELRLARLTPGMLADHIAANGGFGTDAHLVSAGTRAAQAVIGYTVGVPTYFTLLPAATYHALTRRFQENLAARHGAVFIDQPVERSLRLIRLALPAHRRVGILLGPASRSRHAELRAAAAALDLTLVAVTVEGEEAVYDSLERLTERIDVLLALPDPAIYNRRTIRHVLFTTYRHRLPVIGYSRAFVTAGALAAVYSEPAQIARQSAEVLAAALDARPGTRPVLSHPRYFSVAVNLWVARALGLEIPTEDRLLQQLQDSGDRS